MKKGFNKDNKKTIHLLIGKNQKNEKDKRFELIANALDNPIELPILIEDIYKLEPEEDLRLGLIKVQLDSNLRMNENLEYYQKRLYVAESIEKLLFGDLLLEKGKDNDEEEE